MLYAATIPNMLLVVFSLINPLVVIEEFTLEVCFLALFYVFGMKAPERPVDELFL